MEIPTAINPDSSTSRDVFSLSGYCPISTFLESQIFALRNLTHADDEEVQALRGQLYEYVFGLMNFKHPSGLLLHSGSESNEVALWLARHHTRKSSVLTTDLTHQSIQAAAEKLGMTTVVLATKPENGFQVDREALASAIHRHENDIACVVGTFGTTLFGHTESIIDRDEIRELQDTQGVWLHVDAAYGGIIKSEAGDPFLKSCAHADSVTTDLHKFIGVNGCSVLTVKEGTRKDAIQSETSYFNGVDGWLGTTRSAFPSAVAARTIEMIGKKGIQQLAHICVNQAKDMERTLKSNGIETIHPVCSGIVPIKLNGDIESVRSELAHLGWMVSPLRWNGLNGHVQGIRVAITPKPIHLRDKAWQSFTRDLQVVLQERSDARVMSAGKKSARADF